MHIIIDKFIKIEIDENIKQVKIVQIMYKLTWEI